MKYNTTMILDGKTIDVLVEASNPKEAKILTKNQYKNSRVIGVAEVPKNG
jgi:hypothetical protein